MHIERLGRPLDPFDHEERQVVADIARDVGRDDGRRDSFCFGHRARCENRLEPTLGSSWAIAGQATRRGPGTTTCRLVATITVSSAHLDHETRADANVLPAILFLMIDGRVLQAPATDLIVVDGGGTGTPPASRTAVSVDAGETVVWRRRRAARAWNWAIG